MKYPALLLILFCGLTTEQANAQTGAAPRPTAAALIKHFNMARIPQEGPWFVLTYNSSDVLARSALPDAAVTASPEASKGIWPLEALT